MLLLAGSLALTLREGVGTIALPLGIILILIVITLGVLDFYYIGQSDMFKILYNEVQARDEDDIDFSMEVDQYSDQLYQGYKRILRFPMVAVVPLYTFIMVILILGMLPTT